jgi:hypothetical protein
MCENMGRGRGWSGMVESFNIVAGTYEVKTQNKEVQGY